MTEMLQTVKSALQAAGEEPLTKVESGYEVRKLSDQMVEVSWKYSVSGGGPVGPITHYATQQRHLSTLQVILESADCAVLPIHSAIDGQVKSLIVYPPGFEDAAPARVADLKPRIEALRREIDLAKGKSLAWPAVLASRNPVLQVAALYRAIGDAEEILRRAAPSHASA